jgi:hypothetical protein
MFKITIKPTLFVTILSLTILWTGAATEIYRAQAITNTAEYWDKIEKLMKDYYDYPSTENAKKLADALPTNLIRWNKNYIKANELAFDQMSILSRQVWTGDRNALNLAYVLLNISDGALAEELDFTIAALARINPRLYLEELKNHENDYFVKEVRLPLLTGDRELKGNEKSSLLVKELTIKALESVKDKALISLRYKCIAFINEHFK